MNKCRHIKTLIRNTTISTITMGHDLIVSVEHKMSNKSDIYFQEERKKKVYK